jgi:hypothetical protein
MKKMNKVFPLCILFVFLVNSCAVRKDTVDHSFTFLDKWGMVTGYELQFQTNSRTPLLTDQQEKLFLETEQIASAYGREITLTDFYFKRDSIEKKFTEDVVQQMKKHQIKIDNINIINLMVTKQIADALAQRATALKEPEPVRIKVIEY